MSSTNPRPQHPPSDDWLENLYEQVHGYAQNYWRHVLVVVLAIIVVLLGYQSWRTRLRTEEAQAWNQLSDLPALNALMFRQDRQEQHEQIIEQCKEMLAQGWETDATPWVLLKLANTQLAADRLGAAGETLERLSRDYPRHYATQMATKTRATLLEDMRRYEEAAKLYEQLAQKAGEQSPFWMDAGRVRELAGDKEGAIEAYSRLAGGAEEEEAPDFPQARFRYTMLKGGGPLLPPPPEPPAPPEPSQTGEDEGQGPNGLPMPPPDTGPPPPAPEEPGDEELDGETTGEQPSEPETQPEANPDEG